MSLRSTVIDAHQHFWDPGTAEYPWMTGAYSSLLRRYGPEDLEPELREAGVSCTIVVQARHQLDETHRLLEVARTTAWVVGVVGWIDLTAPDVAETLVGLQASPGGKGLVGIRHQVHDETDPNWLLRADVRRGLEAVGTAGLAYDLLVRTRELPAVISVVRDLPGIRFVLDHLAKPPMATGELSPWAELMAELAQLPNVWCKVSGMVTEANWHSWRVEQLAPFVEHVRAVFGPTRLIFGSDWPVCLLAASYAQVCDTARAALGPLTQPELDMVFGATASEVYRLSADDGMR